MVKKRFNKIKGYSLIVATGILLIAIVVFFGIYYVNMVSNELWDSSLNTIIESTDQAGNLITGKMNSERHTSSMQIKTLEKLDSSNADKIQFILNEFNSKEYPVTLIVGDTTYPADNFYDKSFLPENMNKNEYIVPPYISNNSGKRVIALLNGITFQDGVTGIFIREISVNELNGAFSVSIFQNQGHSYLINKQGDILFRSVTSQGNKTSNNLFTIFLNEKGNEKSAIDATADFVTKNHSVWSILNYNGRSNVYYFSPVKSTDWYLVSVVPEATVNAQTQHILRRTFVFVGIILIGFLLLIGLLIFRERQNLIRIEQENLKEKQMIIASNSEVKTIVLGINLLDDSYKVLSFVASKSYDLAHYPTFSELVSSFAKYVDEEYREEYANSFCLSNLRKLQNEDHKFEYREFSMHVNGKKHWLAAEAVLVKSEDNEEMIVYSSRVIDEAKKEEEEKRQILQNALYMAEQANKAKTTFLNSMSHDIRTPMNAIIGFTALAISHIDNKKQVIDYLKKISTSGNHLLSLINDILDMSRIESGSVKIDEKRVHLPDIIHDIRSIIQSSIKAKQLDFFIDTVDVINEDIMCDKLRLNQILLNLLGNAVKYTPSGGTISVRVIQKPSGRSDYARYEFRIKDNGIGMSKEFQEHIFEAFMREETSTVSGIQGTGLGMTITKNIVDMMGGTISVNSEIGVGSEFVVTIQFKICGTTQNYETIPQLQGAKVLVADDDPDTTISVSRMLTQIGMRPDWTLSGKEAIIRTKAALEQGDEYDVYIIDYLMPDMNGIETIRRIRTMIGNSKPIIVLSAYDWSGIEQEARDAGVTAFCEKPLFMSELREILARPFMSHENHESEMEEERAEINFTGKKILLVEDNELNMEIAISILEEVGFEVTGANDGIYAVEMVSNSVPGQYDLILMDIQMPQMDGYTATREIRTLPNSMLANIPIIAMTANAFEEDKRHALEVGMNGFISKPIDIDKLMETLASILC